MMKCREVATKVASRNEDAWTAMQWAAIRFHQWMCPHCRCFAQQMRLIEQCTAQLRALFDEEAQIAETGETLEQRTIKRLEARLPARSDGKPNH